MMEHGNRGVSVEKPKYCGRCGTALEEMPRTFAYNRQTGEPRVHVVLSCPRGIRQMGDGSFVTQPSIHESGHDVWHRMVDAFGDWSSGMGG